MRRYFRTAFMFLVVACLYTPLTSADPNNTFEVDDVRVTRNTSSTYYLFNNPSPNTTDSALQYNPDWDNQPLPGEFRGYSDKLGSSNTTALFEIHKSAPDSEGSYIDYTNLSIPFNKTGNGSGDTGELAASFKRPNFDLKGNEFILLEMTGRPPNNFEEESEDAMRIMYIGGENVLFEGITSPTFLAIDENFNILGSIPITIASLGSTFGMALSWDSNGVITAKYATTFSTFNLNDSSWTALGSTSNIYQSQVPNGYNYFAGLVVNFNPEPSSLALILIGALPFARKRLKTQVFKI